MMVTVLDEQELSTQIFSISANEARKQSRAIKMDSCCTRHMTGYYELVDKVPHKVAVVFGNQQKLFSTHVGTLVLSNGTELKDCLFVLGLMGTLISEPHL